LRSTPILTLVVAQGPIFVTADEPLLVFESIEHAVAYLEWQDVEDGIYRGFDSEGRLVTFGSEPIRSWFFRDKRTVAEVESDPTHADELRVTLARILGVPETTPLDDLEREAIARFGLE
jgi:hypothetical protein